MDVNPGRFSGRNREHAPIVLVEANRPPVDDIGAETLGNTAVWKHPGRDLAYEYALCFDMVLEPITEQKFGQSEKIGRVLGDKPERDEAQIVQGICRWPGPLVRHTDVQRSDPRSIRRRKTVVARGQGDGK